MTNRVTSQLVGFGSDPLEAAVLGCKSSQVSRHPCCLQGQRGPIVYQRGRSLESS